jgi:hypothetical protein
MSTYLVLDTLIQVVDEISILYNNSSPQKLSAYESPQELTSVSLVIWFTTSHARPYSRAKRVRTCRAKQNEKACHSLFVVFARQVASQRS